MNFLSHFYFDRHTTDPNLVLGTALPDLVKNARKDWNLHPEKKASLLRDGFESSILIGWKRHLAVDRYFHNSAFFTEHTHTIRTAIAPVLKDSPVRPSFLAHISLELMLDSILLTENIIDPEDFYVRLRQSDRAALNRFLELNMLDDTPHFFKFFDQFIESEYLNRYREAHNIMYALDRVCMRVWKDPLNETQTLQLTAILTNYNEYLLNDFMSIFKDIEEGLGRTL
ncbi:MAG: ACP phosphodiesterase [Daejeonella sp.]